MEGFWAIAAGAIVAIATYAILSAGASDQARLERMLGVSPEAAARRRRGIWPAIEWLGSFAFATAFDPIVAPRAALPEGDDPERWRRRARGVLLLMALGVIAFAVVTSPLWSSLLVVTPLASRLFVEREMRRAVDSRRRGLERDVTAALDIFVLALDAGLPFERALTAYTESVDSVLAAELRITVRELEVGYRRREVLDRLVSRTRSDALAKLSASVRLAEEFGTPLAGTLRSLAIDMRAERRQRLQEAALRAPVTMLLPTAGFILVPIFLIVLGPVALRIATGRLF